MVPRRSRLCSWPPALASQPAPRVERIAILRFENLGAGVSDDWMGRAFSEVITAELAGAPGIYAIPSNRLHGLDRVLGPRPVSVPGISAERTLAFASGATRLGYGEYSVRGGRLSARLTIEDPRTGKMTKLVSACRRRRATCSPWPRSWRGRSPRRVAPYGTNSVPALKAYMAAEESATAAATAQNLDQAIAADPDFGPPYRLLAQLKAQQQDRAAADALLGQALARAGAMPPAERARLELEAANLHGDSAARKSALTTLVALEPNDAAAWNSLAESCMSRREYQQAVQAYRKLLASGAGRRQCAEPARLCRRVCGQFRYRARRAAPLPGAAPRGSQSAGFAG